MMKIAIKGHESRGKEIIQILENLGGKNNAHLIGNSKNEYYYINDDLNGVIHCHDIYYVNKYCKKYTLEEFEKEFPFKIGDKITNGCEEYLIIDIDLSVCELNYKVRTSLGSVFWVRTCDLIAHQYKQVKEMKEIRNITLTFEKAKEWYKKGGELKEVALQAYSEKELTKIELPKTWEEFCDNYSKQQHETYIGIFSTIESYGSISDRHHIQDKNICPSEKSARAHLAIIQLEQLRDCWRQGWEPIWDNSEKWCIRLWGNELGVGINKNVSRFLTFPTKEMAEEFLKCFKDLIEQAGDLI